MAGLLLCMLTFTVVGGWLGYRRVEILAWDRELEAAFNPCDRQDIPRHRLV